MIGHERVRMMQLALFTTNPDMFRRLMLLAGQIDCDTHMARLADVPADVSEGAVQTNLRRMLRDFHLPFAIIAITGSGEQIKHTELVFRAARKKVPTMLIMCTDGFRHMNSAFDVPFSATGNGRDTFNIVGSVLIGDEDEFAGYDPMRFGEATYLPAEHWQKPNLELLAEHVRRMVKAVSRPVTC